MEAIDFNALSMKGEFLCHHGIKGQAWGITNGPPYPLGSEGKSRHGWFKAKKDKFVKTMTEDTRDRYTREHAHAKTLNRQILRANTATLKEKAKNENAKTEVRKARHARKDAERRERLKYKAEKQKLRDEEKRRHEQIKTEKLKMKAERAEAAKRQNQAQIDQLKQLTPKLKAPNVRSPRQVLVDRVINSGSKKMLRRYGSMLTNDEYKAAQDRIALVKSFKGNKMEKLQNFVSKGAKIVGDVKNAGENIATAYNTANAAAKIFAPSSKLASMNQIKIPSLQGDNKPKTIADKLSTAKDRQAYRTLFRKDPITGKDVKQVFDPKAWVPDYSKGPITNKDGVIQYDNNGQPKYPLKQGGMRDLYYWEDT